MISEDGKATLICLMAVILKASDGVITAMHNTADSIPGVERAKLASNKDLVKSATTLYNEVIAAFG